ncbi:peptidylprolyl isomerase [Shimia sp.]|uniref:peptidylprolyl isomerase n=1 Tax=Shimia sp. TaxID=1954381 RepID=UPI003297CD41
MRQFLKEPLIHFLAMGLLIFAVYFALQDKEPTPEMDEITVSKQNLDRFVARFTGVRQRPPTAEELHKFAESFVDEEVLVREARAMSLDAGDAIIRQRLTQKMNFLAASAAASVQPTEKDLRAYYDLNAEKYTIDGTISFVQVFLGEAPSEAEVELALATLTGGADPDTIGRSAMLPSSLGPATATQVDTAFGNGFYQGLATAKEGAWAGPVRSGFGVHLVWITERNADTVPEFETVMEKVREDWRLETETKFANQQVKAMRQNYSITLPSEADIQAALK